MPEGALARDQGARLVVLHVEAPLVMVDADLSGYFDSIPHADLMKSVARRVSDRHLLHLVKMWLGGTGGRERRTRAKASDVPQSGRRPGSPQGAPISPLLANLYMRRFVLGWKALGHERRLDAHIVNYADDFVICCRGTADEAMTTMRSMMARLKRTVNERKTRVCHVPDERFNFLGYTIGRCYSAKTGRAFIGTRPSVKAMARLKATINEIIDRRWLLLDVSGRVKSLNTTLVGWANYFCLGPVSNAYRAVDAHVRYRLRRWLSWKHKVRGRGAPRFPDQYLYRDLGLIRLQALRTASLSWANA